MRLFRAPKPEAALASWLNDQARRGARAMRLEDALLDNRAVAYLSFRLRFVPFHVTLACVFGTLKIFLLFNSLTRDELFLIILFEAGLFVVSDFWWGLLEGMRRHIRALNREGARYRIPGEIVRWLRFAAWLSCLGLGLGSGYLVFRLCSGTGVTPVDLYLAAVVSGASIGFCVRTYHSGAYALRRIFRPLVSLLVADSLGAACLLALWPLIGLWALPISEVIAVGGMLAITLHYTGRTYRILGLPSVGSLLRTLPSPAATRVGMIPAALLPAAAYALTSVDVLIVFAVLAYSVEMSAPLLATIVASLRPVLRAGTEWAQLMYFDHIRLREPALARLRARFDRAAFALAPMVGVGVWGIFSLSAKLFGVEGDIFLLSMLPLFVARSLLAYAQIRAFAVGAYTRLCWIGFLVILGSLAGISAIGDTRPLALSVVLSLGFLGLLAVPVTRDRDDTVLALPAWLARLGSRLDPVRLTTLTFDQRVGRGVPSEQRQREEWRRAQAASRIAYRVAAQGGAATWLEPHVLAWFDAAISESVIVSAGGGLVARAPLAASFPTGAAAATELMRSWREGVSAAPARDVSSLVSLFFSRFPEGIVYQPNAAIPQRFRTMTSRERSEILRAALRFLEDPMRNRRPGSWDVTAGADNDGALDVIFAVPRTEEPRRRREWTQLARLTVLHNAAFPGQR